MTSVLGLLVIVLAAVAVLRRVDVRLALFLAALALGFLGSLGAFLSSEPPRDPLSILAGPARILRVVLATLAEERFIIPLCCGLGFAQVLKYTGCDQHLVHLLVKPLTRVRFLLIPGAVVVGFLVNIPIISQTSTAVTVGSVLIPLLLAARISPVTVGAALLLGCSIGGELFNPGAPEIQSVVATTMTAAGKLGMADFHMTPQDCVERAIPLSLVQLLGATLVFWFVSARAERRSRKEQPEPGGVKPDAFRVNLFFALIPILPIGLLFLTTPTFNILPIPKLWLVDNANDPRFDSRLIGTAMLIGVAVAMLAKWRTPSGVVVAFFDGAGYAYTHIISIIVVATAFADGIKQIGLAEGLGHLLMAVQGLLLPLTSLAGWSFALLCGSGMASTQGMIEFFAKPALELGADPAHVGAVMSLSAAAGRTMSPVAAVALMCARMTNTNVIDLTRRTAVPVLAGVAVMLLIACLVR